MAKVETFSDAIKDMMKNVDKVSREVAQKVSEKMTVDIANKTQDILDKYYSYKKGSYTKSGRTYQLYEMYETDLPKAVKASGGYIARGRVKFDPNILEYHSNSSKHNGDSPWSSGGDVESSYVYDELFFEGKHPWYSGAPYNDGSYTLIKHGVNVGKAFKDFDNKYDDQYLHDYFNSIVAKTMQKYF